jgi:uncharacterized protein (TIGR00270 family)
MDCEICGNESNRLVKRLIEGVEMYVCEECQDLGVPVKKTRQKKTEKVVSRNRPEVIASKSYERSTERQETERPKYTPKQEVIKPDACEILQQTRAKQGLSIQQFADAIQEKQNYYARIERGKVALPLSLAKRIEEKYRIKLTEVIETSEDIETAKIYKDYFTEDNEPPMRTLGDMIKIKKKTNK